MRCDWRVGLRSAGLVLALVLACRSDDGDDDGADEVGDGDGDPGDGDGDPGDGDGDPGDGDGEPGDGDGDGEPGDGDGDGDGGTFGELCLLGCQHFLECAPDVFAGLYASLDECEAACSIYVPCMSEAIAYFECFLGLSCADVELATTDGPALTECGPSFAAAQDACGL